MVNANFSCMIVKVLRKQKDAWEKNFLRNETQPFISLELFCTDSFIQQSKILKSNAH